MSRESRMAINQNAINRSDCWENVCRRVGADGSSARLAGVDRSLNFYSPLHITWEKFSNHAMSRIIIKNLPSYITQAKLRSHLEDKGPKSQSKSTITDVQLPSAKDGSSRRFAFVGYKSEKEAEAAKEWFDKTFIDTTRVRVELVVDGLKERPRKRRKLDDGREEEQDENKPVKKDKKGKGKVKAEETTKPSQMDEFVSLQTKKKGPSWADDLLPAPTKKPAVAPVAPDEPEDGAEVDVDAADDAAEGTEGLSDMDWLRRHMSKNVDKDEPAFEQSDDEDEKMADQV
jgi:multiple RNA-binding domain-containing protein 1